MFENLLVWSSSKAFIPHGTCLIWNSPLIWLHVASDSLIAASYYSIPFALAYFVHRRTDLAYRWIFLLFAAFILACGTTHLLDIWTLWHPDYVLQ
ncbi:MAG: domain S-box, partial [Proteobacteria bacterium]|nr:domain S-box [Pseudomonadota bacterium]